MEGHKASWQVLLKDVYQRHKEPFNLRSICRHTEKCVTLPKRFPEVSNPILTDFIDIRVFDQHEHFCRMKPTVTLDHPKTCRISSPLGVCN